jgi:hypothetical protein
MQPRPLWYAGETGLKLLDTYLLNVMIWFKKARNFGTNNF